MRLLLIGLVLTAAVLQAQAPAWHAGMVKITSKGKAPGSGFVVALRDGNAYVVTAAHVVGLDVQVNFYVNPDRTYPATIRNSEAESEDRALAVLRVANPPSGVTVVPAATEALSVPGTRVEVGGFPASEGAFIPLETTGTRTGRDLTLSAQTPPGYSGGPVIRNGAVIGLVYGRTGFGKALGIATVRDFLEGNGIAWESSVASPPRDRPHSVTVPQRQPGDKQFNSKDGLTYVWIPPGKFTMGCSLGDKECYKDESPAHEVEITKGFWIGQTEVTQAAYQKVVGSNPSNFKGADRPVEQVNWEQAGAYCKAAGLRLPTEAEWEYAARAGSSEARYGPVEAVAWYAANSGGETHSVASKTPNAWGLYDTLGNVWEWVSDWYDPQYYAKRVRLDPTGPASSPEQSRGVRGASWFYDPGDVRASFRNGYGPTSRDIINGFRCAGELR